MELEPQALPAEALLAVSGVLRDEPLTQVSVETANGIPEAWADDVHAFFTETAWRPWDPPADVDHEETYTKLSEVVTPDLEATLTENIRDQALAMAYLERWKQAREYLRTRWPINVLELAMGPELLPPSLTEEFQAADLYAVVNDPRQVLREMLMGTLLPHQSEAFRTLYPALKVMLDQLIQVEIAELRAKEDAFLEPERERMLRILLGLPVDVPLTRLEVKPQRAPEPPPATTIDIDFSAEQPRSADRERAPT